MSRRPRDRQAERAALDAAADRLLAGTPLHSRTGKLTATELVAESGLRRDVLYEHRDLVDQFKARVRAQHSTPAALQALNDERDALLKRLDAITTELGHERAITATLRRLATELSLELQQAREELAARTNVTRMPTRSTAVIGSCS
jgi:hypothetical protein